MQCMFQVLIEASQRLHEQPLTDKAGFAEVKGRLAVDETILKVGSHFAEPYRETTKEQGYEKAFGTFAVEQFHLQKDDLPREQSLKGSIYKVSI